MSFKRFDAEDIVISADSITAPAWTGNTVNLSTFHIDSNQRNSTSGEYYLNVYQTGSTESTSAIQFSVAYGHLYGSGSAELNSNVTGYGPSRIVYGQYRSLINGTEETNLSFGGSTPKSIFPISIERARFKEKLFPGSLTIGLTGPAGAITLTDDSNYATTETFTDAGRVYNLISGSAGVVSTALTANGYSNGSGSYGALYPDAGLLVLNGDALALSAGNGGIGLVITSATDSIAAADQNNFKLFEAISASAADASQPFVLRSEETVSSNYVFVRARNSEFNYSTNPSNITGSGELRHNVMIDSPQGYITAVGLYNDNNDLLAVAKLSRPLLKDFTKEALIRIKLDY